MPMNKKTVHCKISFDEKGNVVDVETGDGKHVEGKPLKDNPIHGVIGMATIMVTADDDPCVIQGGIRYCW